LSPQDVFRLLTPGGGGFGPPEDGAGGAPQDPPDPQDLWAPQNPQNPQNAPNPPTPQTFLERGSVFEFRQAQEAV
ncbi:OPLA oxoprolinase, partial [Molothrus ater]|nr:OPLA oxoprolinase [Molothrus ater]